MTVLVTGSLEGGVSSSLTFGSLLRDNPLFARVLEC